MKFQTHYRRAERDHEVNTKPSLTIPDQTMTVVQIMQRYAQGLPLTSGVKVPIYEGEDSEVPLNWDKMDISEQQDFMEENAQRIVDMRNDLQDQQYKRGRYKPKDKVQNKDDQKPKDNQQSAPSADGDDSKK